MSKHIDKDKTLEYIAPTIEVSEGYVSREVVLSLLRYWGGVYTDDKIIEMIESLPPVKSKPVCEDAISKGKLITDLQGIWDAYTPNNMTDFQDMLEDIYNKIKDAPPVEPKIYGNEHNCIMTIFGECSYSETGCGSCEVVSKVNEALKAERPKGEWEEVEKSEHGVLSIVSMRCNQCGRYAYLVLPKGTKCVYDYCPNCGAIMVGESE